MIPEAIANEPSTETVQLKFQEPLTPEDSLLIKLLAERYAGKDGVPFMTFSRDGVTTLVCPKAIRRVLPWRLDDVDTLTAEAPSALRISTQGGD